MAKEKRFWYECILQCDLGYYAPDGRRERWVKKGRAMIQPTTMHIVRLLPEHGLNGRGEPFPADYIVTDKPLGRSYVEAGVTKAVSRPATAFGNIGGLKPRVMREKVNKVKFRLLDTDEITSEVRRQAWDYGLPVMRDGKQVEGWAASIFEANDKDVELPAEEALNARAVATDVAVEAAIEV